MKALSYPSFYSEFEDDFPSTIYTVEELDLYIFVMHDQDGSRAHMAIAGKPFQLHVERLSKFDANGFQRATPEGKEVDLPDHVVKAARDLLSAREAFEACKEEVCFSLQEEDLKTWNG